MQPNKQKITINDNEEKIIDLLMELVLLPRINAIKWSRITRQTPNIKIGYPGQHLASLVSGMTGEGTGARGNDLVDGTEVKSCSRIDQLDQCGDCKLPVTRFETQCPQCNSVNILRKNDSKWLFSVRNEGELNTLLHSVKRIILLIGDYPDFANKDYETIRFQAFEIWTESERNNRFAEIISNYYYKIYLEHKKQNQSSNPAPKNFWPYSYQFYLCNPINIFSCVVKNSHSKPEIKIDYYVKPSDDRSTLPSPIMPLNVITDEEIKVVLSKASEEEIINNLVDNKKLLTKKELLKSSLLNVRESFLGFDESLRKYLPLRDTDKISIAKATYARRSTSL